MTKKKTKTSKHGNKVMTEKAPYKQTLTKKTRGRGEISDITKSRRIGDGTWPKKEKLLGMREVRQAVMFHGQTTGHS